jgi:hypothetical protein
VRPIVIVTLATHQYLPKVRRYLETLDKQLGVMDAAMHRGGDPLMEMAYLGAVACDGQPATADLPYVRTFRVPPGMLARSLGNPGNGCIQHGNWLPYLPVAENAVIICTDGDIRMQRPFTDAELAWLQSWKDGDVGIGPNAHPGDTLNDEAGRIKHLIPIEELARRFYPSGSIDDPPLCGNAGCIVATRRTWIDLWLGYLALWMETAQLFGHIAVQQWTINLAIARGFNRVVLPGTFHAHGHYGVPAGADGWGTERATFNGEVVAFAHRCWHQYPPEWAQ